MFPLLDGLAGACEYDLRSNVRYTAATVRAAMGRRHIRMRVTGPPGGRALLNRSEAEPGFRAVRAEDSNWHDEFLAKPSQSLLRVRPIRDADRVRCPLLLCLAAGDTMVPLRPIERAAVSAPRGELRRYPVGHFDGFLEAFEDVVGDQLEFFDRHLEPPPAA